MNEDQMNYTLRARLIHAQNERDELSRKVELLKADIAQTAVSRDTYKECWTSLVDAYSKQCAKQQRSNEYKYYGIVDNRIERLELIDEDPGQHGYTYFHTYDTAEKLVILEDGQWIAA